MLSFRQARRDSMTETLALGAVRVMHTFAGLPPSESWRIEQE